MAEEKKLSIGEVRKTIAVSLAAAQGVRVLGASNYYDYDIYAGFAQEAARLMAGEREREL